MLTDCCYFVSGYEGSGHVRAERHGWRRAVEGESERVVMGNEYTSRLISSSVSCYLWISLVDLFGRARCCSPLIVLLFSSFTSRTWWNTSDSELVSENFVRVFSSLCPALPGSVIVFSFLNWPSAQTHDPPLPLRLTSNKLFFIVFEQGKLCCSLRRDLFTQLR